MKSLAEEVTKVLDRQRQGERAKEFLDWCGVLDTHRGMRRLEPGWVAEIELQPHRWLRAGMRVLESANVSGRVQLLNGQEGEPFNSYLPYPVFLTGAELFLKGMWLCRFPECRRVSHNGYVTHRTRDKYLKKLQFFGHDLLKLIQANRRLKRYREDATCVRFLERLRAVVCEYYYPLYRQDQRGAWSAARYPKRFYDDDRKVGSADSLLTFPQQRLIVKLFKPMEFRIDEIWQIRRGLIEKQKRVPRRSS